MLEVYKMVLTASGQALHAKCLAGSSGITFTKFVLGDGTYSGTESVSDLAARTSLKNAKNEFKVSKASVVNNATCKLEMNASNLEITAGYYVREIGVYAKGSDGIEILYSLTVAKPDKPDWMPAYNGVAPGSLRYIEYISVGNAENISINVDAGGLASQDDLDSLTDRVIALEEGQAGCVGIKRKCADDGTPVSNTAWTRFGNTKGMSAVYARGNDEIDDPIMKVWPFNQLKPCDLNMDGTVAAYLGDADFVWSGDDISVMLEIPSDMYFARWYAKDSDGQNWEYRVFSDSQRYPNSVSIKDLMKRSDGTKTDHWYFPIFLGSKNSAGHYVSVSGVVPLYNSSVTAYRTAVKTNGDNWQIIDKWAWDIMTNLILCYSAESNVRTTFGRGHADWYYTKTSLLAESSVNKITVSNDANFEVGQTVCIGTSGAWNADIAKDRKITAVNASDTANAVDIVLDGAAFTTTTKAVIWRSAPFIGETTSMANANGTAGANDGKHAVRTLWVEDFYATMHTGIDGMNLKYNSDSDALDVYVCADPSKYSDTYDGFTKLDESIPVGDGWIKKEAFNKHYPTLEYPVSVNNGAGSETYEAAYKWSNKNGQRPFAGGSFGSGSRDSVRYLDCNNDFGVAHWYYASRPLKR
jgi:hypothetical protein